jgi:hypothetical protein
MMPHSVLFSKMMEKYSRKGACTKVERCHGLAPWKLTLDATPILLISKNGCHGLEPWRFTFPAK